MHINDIRPGTPAVIRKTGRCGYITAQDSEDGASFIFEEYDADGDILSGIFHRVEASQLDALNHPIGNVSMEDEILNFATTQWGERTDEKVALKACGECGEFAEAVTKIGEGRATHEDADEEVGDILIVLSQWAAKRGTTLEALRSAAFAKIQARAAAPAPCPTCKGYGGVTVGGAFDSDGIPAQEPCPDCQ